MIIKTNELFETSTHALIRRGYILESAGDGGLLMVSGLKHSDGEGDLSRFVTAPKPNESPWPKLSVRLFVPPPILAECPRCALGMPSTGIPFSDKNSSRSAYYRVGVNQIKFKSFHCDTHTTKVQRLVSY